ncbi:MAG: biotin/lipoate A/B protein ligase family protein [Thermoplasmata archaeon]
MDKIRYIPTIEDNGPRQMAIDEAILRCYDKGLSPPTLRFFKFSPSAITMGYAQDVKNVIDTDRCRELDMPYVRRITGGGTVYHDLQGEITYSIVTDKISGSIEDSFHHLLKPIINTLQGYGLDAAFKPYNDILVNGKKISGSAQRRAKKGMLQHGTLMYATDLSTLASILLLDEEKLRAKGAGSFFDLVTTMEDELGRKLDPDELIIDMKDAYKKHLQVELVPDELNEEELDMVDKLTKKYSDERWTYNRKWKV